MSTHNENGHLHQVSSFIDDCAICHEEIIVYSMCEQTDCRAFVTLDYDSPKHPEYAGKSIHTACYMGWV